MHWDSGPEARRRFGHWCTVVIEDISGRKWEDLGYAVSDTEEEVFSVFCREFTAVIQ